MLHLFEHLLRTSSAPPLLIQTVYDPTQSKKLGKQS